jgi:hypothetical protein
MQSFIFTMDFEGKHFFVGDGKWPKIRLNTYLLQ